ncbi:MAG: 6-carboxytetrahydropterin synthase [Bacteroidota bacterium]
MIRITKEIDFEMAHVLYGYDGPCAGIHGHSYRLSVTVRGIPIPKGSKKNFGGAGLVIDFSDLKKIMNEKVISVFDHALVIWNEVPLKNMKKEKWFCKNIIRVPYQPTCENLIVDFADRIKKQLPNNIDLISVKLRETSSTQAEWLAEENQ